ncbi:MAG TPA: flavin reductase family protein [Dehalococcoidales bacterium]|nr:flavin reductase family protein [Dehalococcoidales bacterium]
MTKMISDSIGKFSHHYPRVAIIVTAQANGRENAMAVGWYTPIAFKPPLYGVAIMPGRFTYQLIVDSKEFGVNFLPFEEAELIASVGGSSGREIDKFQRFNIGKDKPVKTAVPILKAAYAAYECKLVDDKGYGDHRFLVGEVVAVHFSKESFTSEEILDLNEVNPALYLGHDIYVTTSKDAVKSLDRGVYGKR